MTTATLSGSYAVTSDATFQAYTKHVIDSFVAGGLIRTSDTGQINEATVTTPAANSSAGFAMFRFNDTLQSSKPLFIKVEFGFPGTYTNKVNLWYTIGKGSDGAGNVTGILRPRTAYGRTDSSAGVTGPYATWVTGGQGYFGFFPQIDDPSTGYACQQMLWIERSVTGDAIVVGTQSTPSASGLLALSTANSFPAFDAITYDTGALTRGVFPVLVPNSINGTVLGSSSSLAAGSIGPVYPLLAVAPSLAPMQCTSALSYPGGDAPGTTFTVTLGGVTRTYRPIPINNNYNGFGLAFSAGVATSTNSRYIGLAIRWE